MKSTVIVESIIDYLKAKNWLDLLPEIADGLMQASYTRVDQNSVVVTSVVTLKPAQKLALEQTLERLTNHKIRVKYLLDPDLIGGLKIAYGGKVIDTSINQQIELIGQKLNYD